MIPSSLTSNVYRYTETGAEEDGRTNERFSAGLNSLKELYNGANPCSIRNTAEKMCETYLRAGNALLLNEIFYKGVSKVEKEDFIQPTEERVQVCIEISDFGWGFRVSNDEGQNFPVGIGSLP